MVDSPLYAYRALANADPYAWALHRRFDIIMGHIMKMEEEHGLLRALMLGGCLVSYRKLWSYKGVLADGRDLGNWAYVVIMRHFFACGLTDHNECNDGLLGDVIEAVLHVGFTSDDPHQAWLREFAELFNESCLVFECMKKWFVQHECWESSKVMALLLC